VQVVCKKHGSTIMRFTQLPQAKVWAAAVLVIHVCVLSHGSMQEMCINSIMPHTIVRLDDCTLGACPGILYVWNIKRLESYTFGILYIWNIIHLEYYTFGTLYVMNIIRLEYYTFGILYVWNIIRLECYTL
jgi:hypothetical protein